MFAPPICRRRWRDNAFPFRQIRRRRRQPSEHPSERSEQSNTARCASSSKRGVSIVAVAGQLFETADVCRNCSRRATGPQELHPGKHLSSKHEYESDGQQTGRDG